MATTTAAEFEAKVWEVEGVRLFIRGSRTQKIPRYTYTNRADNNWTIQDLLTNRIYQSTGAFEVEVLNGDFLAPPRHTRLKTIRDTY